MRRVIVRLIRPNDYDDELGDIPETACRWFYVLRFPDVQAQPTVEGFPVFLVTMSGELARMVVEDWPQPENRPGD